jgi:hypothetical protein
MTARQLQSGNRKMMADKLDIGAPFPRITLKLVSGDTLTLPEGLNARYGIVLFYRGHW